VNFTRVTKFPIQPENLIGDGENFLPSFAKCLPAYYVPFVFDYRANINQILRGIPRSFHANDYSTLIRVLGGFLAEEFSFEKNSQTWR